MLEDEDEDEEGADSSGMTVVCGASAVGSSAVSVITIISSLFFSINSSSITVVSSTTIISTSIAPSIIDSAVVSSGMFIGSTTKATSSASFVRSPATTSSSLDDNSCINSAVDLFALNPCCFANA